MHIRRVLYSELRYDAFRPLPYFPYISIYGFDVLKSPIIVVIRLVVIGVSYCIVLRLLQEYEQRLTLHVRGHLVHGVDILGHTTDQATSHLVLHEWHRTLGGNM